MGNLTAKYQWGIILGLFLGTQALNNLAENNRSLQPFLIPVILVLVIFAFSTWVIRPVSNLFLRFNAYGKFLLDKKEKVSSNFVAVSLAILLTGLGAYIFLSDVRYAYLAVYGFVMMVLCGLMFLPSKYNSLLWYTIAMAVLGGITLGMAFSNNPNVAVFNNLAYAFVIGFIAFQFLVNFVMIRRTNK